MHYHNVTDKKRVNDGIALEGKEPISYSGLSSSSF